MRRAFAGVALAAALLLTACTGLPTSGPVYPGNPVREVEDAPAPDLLSAPPQPGASPQQIVDGFLVAGASARDDWATAREYLTPEIRSTWQPLASVTVDRLSERSTSTLLPASSPTASAAPQTVDIVQRVTSDAFVSGAGEYTPAEGRASTLNFRLEQVDGQWRISEAPDGLVLYREVFATVYQPASVMYFDPTFTFLVPDVRWFPRSLIAARVAQAVVDLPPSEWLEDSVVTAFPEGVDLASGAVPLVDGAARVELDSGAFGLEQRTLDRMLTQLEMSLASVDIDEVQMTVGTTSLGGQEVAVQSTRVDQKPLVELADGGFGYLGAEALEIIPGLSQAVTGLDARAVSVSRDRTSAAVLTASGAVVRARDDGTVQQLDASRPDLLAPSVDPAGVIWSVSRSDPAAFLAFPDDGDPVPVAAAWPGSSEVIAFQVSRDGTRLAALVTANGRTEVWASGIVREGSTPVAIGEPLLVASTTAAGIGLAWLDGTSVGVVLRSDSGSSILRQPIGGRGDATTVESGVVDIAGGNSTVRLRTDAGALLIERGSIWEEAAEGVIVLGVQQGPLE